ncbi:MAG: T9SS type A sorting domain-containing protein [Saprospiraceae bacterium]
MGASLFPRFNLHTQAEAYFEKWRAHGFGTAFEQPSAVSQPFSAAPSPNPFHKTTVIGFELAALQQVTLTVFDLTGRVWPEQSVCTSGR